MAAMAPGRLKPELDSRLSDMSKSHPIAPISQPDLVQPRGRNPAPAHEGKLAGTWPWGPRMTPQE